MDSLKNASEQRKPQSLQLFRAFQALKFLKKHYLTYPVAIPSLFQGISSYNAGSPRKTQTGSQSLHFFRAFQEIFFSDGSIGNFESQSLHFFRAFQDFTQTLSICFPSSRNPFTFSGHFKHRPPPLVAAYCSCRNPFTFSGHFKFWIQWEE